MKKSTLTLLKDPSKDLYGKLIDYAAGECKFLQLVVRKTMPLGSNGTIVLEKLESYLISKIESSEWPGTKLLEGTALIFRYYFRPECAEILKRAANSLFSWKQPNLPEDLSFFKDDEDIWLASITHEKDGYLCLSKEEKLKLFQALPEVQFLLREDTSR